MDNTAKLERQTGLEALKNEARFQFASAALVGILSAWEGEEFPREEYAARKAFQFADAMVRESVKW